jgi:hypothetical protein
MSAYVWLFMGQEQATDKLQRYAGMQQHPQVMQLAVQHASTWHFMLLLAGRLAVRTGMPSYCLAGSCSVLGKASVQQDVC